MADKAKLPALGYGSVAEALGERFHVSPALLQALNRGDRVRQSRRRHPGAERDAAAAAEDRRHEHSRQQRAGDGRSDRSRRASSWPAIRPRSAALTIRFRSASGRSTAWRGIRASTTTPICSGMPRRARRRRRSRRDRTVRSASVWIDLSKPHYGIHGTPEPSTIGKTTSHGCIRLTNWDATRAGESGHARNAGGPGEMKKTRIRCSASRSSPDLAWMAAGTTPNVRLLDVRRRAGRRRRTRNASTRPASSLPSTPDRRLPTAPMHLVR